MLRGLRNAYAFQSTLSMRRATRRRRLELRTWRISIHALHEESDTPNTLSFSPPKFQSTLSMRRATIAVPYAIDFVHISIHALHEESDATAQSSSRGLVFQSTLSMRRATNGSMRTIDDTLISIHALHEESDSAAGHFCPLFETQASCLALSISNNTADTTNNMSKTSNWLSVSF